MHDACDCIGINMPQYIYILHMCVRVCVCVCVCLCVCVCVCVCVWMGGLVRVFIVHAYVHAPAVGE